MPSVLTAEHIAPSFDSDWYGLDHDAIFQGILEAEKFDEDPELLLLNGALNVVAGKRLNSTHNNAEHEHITDGDRLLTEVDHLIRDLDEFGEFREETCRGIHQNLTTAIQEQAMPSAVTETRHEAVYDEIRRTRIFLWMGKTAVENAMSGYVYHRHASALRRVDVEVDEAEHSASMEFGKARIFISPKMTQHDASKHIAKEEHLHADDAIRVSWLETNGRNTERVMQSLLVKDVPFEAWIAMLEDPHSLFGKAISLEDRVSALSVMKAHRQLELPLAAVPDGPVSVVAAVIPYIKDQTAREKVEVQLQRYFQYDQADLMAQAMSKADEWLAFEKELAVSLKNKRANLGLASFIKNIESYLSEDDARIVGAHKTEEGYSMTRELAAAIESAMQLFLASRAAILADPEHVLAIVKDVNVLADMQRVERELMSMQVRDVLHMQHLAMMQQQAIVHLGIRPNGGGCPGENKTKFELNIGTNAGPEMSGANNQADGSEKTETNEACSYSGTFCYCCPYNDDGTKASKPITVTAFRDSNGIATCQRTGCGATMEGDKVTYKGAIWERAQALEKR